MFLKKYRLCLAPILLGALLIAGCSSVTTVTVTKTINQTTTDTIGLNDVYAVVQADLGKPFTISLKSNPSTGYVWSETHSVTWLQLLGKTYVPDVPNQTSTGLPIIIVGGGGIDNLSFLASQKGAALIVMRYARASGTTAEQKVFLIVVE